MLLWAQEEATTSFACHISILEQIFFYQNRSINPGKPIRIHFHLNKSIIKKAATLVSVLGFQSQSVASLEWTRTL